jgi:hypothetical protein
MASPKVPKVQVFHPVPVGRRVRWVVLFISSAVVLFVGMHLGLLILLPDAIGNLLAWLALILGPITVALMWYGARIRFYLIDGSDLVIDRAFFPIRIPLANYTLVHEFRGRVGAVDKVMGNDGLGAVAGYFQSAEHGHLRIYASDLAHSIMLEGPSEKLIVSPSDPAAFIEAVLFHFYTRAP